MKKKPDLAGIKLKDIPLPINELYDAVGQLSKIVGGREKGEETN